MTTGRPKAGASSGAFFNDPDRQNSEQNEEGSQAQDVSADALAGETAEDSEPANNDDPFDIVPRDVPDLVDVEKAMIRSGRIDMDALEGEPKMDDEDS